LSKGNIKTPWRVKIIECLSFGEIGKKWVDLGFVHCELWYLFLVTHFVITL